MKLFIFISIALLLCCQSFSQSMYTRVSNYLLDEGYTIEKSIYADIAEGETTYVWYTFEAGTTYIIYGFTEDEDVQDLDLTVNYKDGSVYKRDLESDATPVLIFTPYYTRTMKVILKNYSSDTPDYQSTCRFFIGSY